MRQHVLLVQSKPAQSRTDQQAPSQRVYILNLPDCPSIDLQPCCTTPTPAHGRLTSGMTDQPLASASTAQAPLAHGNLLSMPVVAIVSQSVAKLARDAIATRCTFCAGFWRPTSVGGLSQELGFSGKVDESTSARGPTVSCGASYSDLGAIRTPWLPR